MDASIRVFNRKVTEKNGLVKKLIKHFEDAGYKVLVDFLHGEDGNWLTNNIAGPSAAYCVVDEEVERIDLKSILQDEIPIDLLITFNVGTEIDFTIIDACVKMVLSNDPIEYVQEVWAAFNRVVLKPATQNIVVDQVVGDEIVKSPLENYSYREFNLIALDCLVVEIKKPFTDKPYVTLIKNYSKEGDGDIFCNFYACTSWGVSDADNAFMSKIWEWKMMAGVFNCNEIVRQKIEKIEKGLAEEPKVWRSTMEKIIEIIKDPRYKGLGVKRSGSPRMEFHKRSG